MTNAMHPQVAEALRQAELFQSALEGQLHAGKEQTYTGTDEAKTVAATVDGRLVLIGLEFEDGLLRQDAETVEQHINEALQNAQAAATEATDADHDRLVESLSEIADSLKKTLGLD